MASAPGRLAGLWRAHPAVQGVAAQRRARLAAAILLAILAA
ncbi:MAG: hypothetical protein QOI63_430, partial [Thermoplasmata archaeon]|nr:hypothetical protein [Thermoplasmata archaeon]